jgi:hypothetical protein
MVSEDTPVVLWCGKVRVCWSCFGRREEMPRRYYAYLISAAI